MPLTVVATDPERFSRTVVRSFPQFVPIVAPSKDGLGVQVLAEREVPMAKVMRTANVLAQYLDNDEDGKFDNPKVVKELEKVGASIVLYHWTDPEAPDDEVYSLEDREALAKARGLQDLAPSPLEQSRAAAEALRKELAGLGIRAAADDGVLAQHSRTSLTNATHGRAANGEEAGEETGEAAGAPAGEEAGAEAGAGASLAERKGQELAAAQVIVDSPDLGLRLCAKDDKLICDDTLQLAWQLVAIHGYAEAFPDVFGTTDETFPSELSRSVRRLNGNCGFAGKQDQLRPPNCTGWFFDGDPTCDWPCQVSRGLYLAVATVDGQLAADGCKRGFEAALPQEWALCGANRGASRVLVQQWAPDLYALAMSSAYKLPRRMPDGFYQPGLRGRSRKIGAAVSAGRHPYSHEVPSPPKTESLRAEAPRAYEGRVIGGFSTALPRQREVRPASAHAARVLVSVDARGRLQR